jgi:hypothetical protein
MEQRHSLNVRLQLHNRFIPFFNVFGNSFKDEWKVVFSFLWDLFVEQKHSVFFQKTLFYAVTLLIANKF